MKEQELNKTLPIYKLDYELVKSYENESLKYEIEEFDGENKIKKKIEPGITHITVSPCEKYVIAGYTTGHITIFDKKTTKVVKTLRDHRKKVLHIEMYKPENKVLTCGEDGNIFIYDLSDFSLVNKIAHPFVKKYEKLIEIRFALVSKNMEHIYFGSNNGCLYKCDKSSNYKPRIFVNPNDMYPPEAYYLTSGVFSPDKKHIVFSSGSSLKFVDVKTGKVEKMIGETEDFINDIVFHPLNENIIVSWSEDGTITYWDIEAEHELFSFDASDTQGFSHLSFDSTGHWLASGNDEVYVNIWDSVTKHQIGRITNADVIDNMLNGSMFKAKSLLFTKDNQLLTCSYNGIANLWELKQI